MKMLRQRAGELVARPRRPVIPRLGPLHGTLARFTPSQAIFSRLSAGPDVHRFDGLVDHTGLLPAQPPQHDVSSTDGT